MYVLVRFPLQGSLTTYNTYSHNNRLCIFYVFTQYFCTLLHTHVFFLFFLFLMENIMCYGKSI